jgi:hypothetical protein
MYRSVIASECYAILKYVSLPSESILGYIYLYQSSFRELFTRVLLHQRQSSTPPPQATTSMRVSARTGSRLAVTQFKAFVKAKHPHITSVSLHPDMDLADMGASISWLAVHERYNGPM